MYSESERPRIKIIPSSLTRILDLVAYAGLIFLWIYTLLKYTQLPSIIPVHFNEHGEVNGYGSRAVIFIIPPIVTLLVALLTLVSRYPHVFNYTVQINEQNAEQQYKRAVLSLKYMKVAIVAIFIFTELEFVHDTYSKDHQAFPWDIPLLVLLLLIPTIIYFVYSFKKRKRG
jgi:uncharacterized membrane protein